MSIKQKLMEWNKSKWEYKNRVMYDQVKKNVWPWYNEELDPDLENVIAESGLKSAEILDLGTCSGSQAIELARLGHKVVGSDISETALDSAKAALELAEGVSVEFVIDDIADSNFEENQFDIILDRGCYHSICCLTHQAYVENIRRILRPGGLLLLKTMSSDEKRFIDYDTIAGKKIQMPYHFKRQELLDMFANVFEVVDIRDSFFYSTQVNPPAQARFTIIRNNK